MNSRLIQRVISELGELQVQLQERIDSANAARNQTNLQTTNATEGLLTELEAADIVEATAIARALAEKLSSLVSRRILKDVEIRAGRTRHTVSISTTTTTDVTVSVENGTRAAYCSIGRSPPTPVRRSH